MRETMTAPPYISDPATPRCPSCGATIYVQAQSYEVEFKLMNGKTEKRIRYRVGNYLVETAPALLSACRCAWLRERLGRVIKREQEAAAAA